MTVISFKSLNSISEIWSNVFEFSRKNLISKGSNESCKVNRIKFIKDSYL